MPDNRTFAGSQATVTVGLVDGQSKTGSIGAFEPTFDEIVMKVSVRNMDGSIDRIGVHVPRERVSYVAFYRDTHAVVPPEADTLGETRVYAPGGNTFSVWVRLDALGDPVGFYGYPVSRASLYSEVFFFADGINAVEDATPLGELLVQEGLVDNDALREGCLAQAAGRESPIGQILVEQEVIEPEQVEQAAADQGGRLRSGKPQRLGEILVEAGLATAAQIERALTEQRQRRGKRLGEVLVDLGIVAEEVIARTLARKFHVPYVGLDSYDVDPEAAGAIPLGIIERFGVLPVRADARTLTIAMSDPTAIEALDMLRFSLDRKLSEVVVRPSQLDRYIEPYLPRADEEDVLIESALSELLEAEPAALDETDEDVEAMLREEGAITRLAYKLILAAYHRGASDIHIEPNGKERAMDVRLRVDGECAVYRKLPPGFRANLVARLKIMAGLDITERRRPQDGKIRLRLRDRKLELRVATLPTVDGNEDVVI